MVQDVSCVYLSCPLSVSWVVSCAVVGFAYRGKVTIKWRRFVCPIYKVPKASTHVQIPRHLDTSYVAWFAAVDAFHPCGLITVISIDYRNSLATYVGDPYVRMLVLKQQLSCVMCDTVRFCVYLFCPFSWSQKRYLRQVGIVTEGLAPR